MSGLLVLAAVGAAVWSLDHRVRAYLAGAPLGGTRVYAAPRMLRPGVPSPPGSLLRTFTRLGYREIESPTATLAPGELRAGRGVLEVAQRASPAPWADAPRHARVTLADGRVHEIRDDRGRRLERLELEPEVLAVIGGDGSMVGASADETPAVCRDAVLAAEDQQFFRHPGLNPVAILRALIVDIRAGARRQGGSTITQQLVKNAFLTPQRTLRRKIQEAALAMILEARATKEEILGRYLTSVYLGAHDGLPVHGFAQAADVYFAKPVGKLDVTECALLAGMIQAPNRLNPRRNPKLAAARRDRVIDAMADVGFVDAAAASRAKATPIRLAPARARPATALYVAAEVSRTLARELPDDLAQASGLRVFTTVDADAQRRAEGAVARGLAALEVGRSDGELQAALVALDPHRGDVRALVGGRGYGSSPLDRATRSRRQPGSAFKPFVYLAALDPSRRGDASPWTVVSGVEDEPLLVRQGRDEWQPANYDHEFVGTMPLEDALAGSRNVPTVRIALDVGLDAVVRTAVDMGLPAPPRVPSVALGVGETSLLELTAAYGIFASGGTRHEPSLVLAVTSSAGETLWAATPSERRVMDPGVAYLMTHLLERVVNEGTGRGARLAGLRGPAAGKTGTTDDERDAWFVGFTPAVVAGVWVGRDAGGSTGLSGAQAALPIWTDFVAAVTDPESRSAFPIPDDVVWREVDPATGQLATSACRERRRAPFLVGTEPTTVCSQHRPLWRHVRRGVEETVRGGGRAIGRERQRFGEWFRGLFR